MKLLNKAIVAVVAVIGFGMSVFGGGIVSIDEVRLDEGMVPVLLNCEEDLSCFSLTLSHDNIVIAAKDIRINGKRFPWNRRAMTITANEDKREIIFTVADFIGQNVMVSKGEGTLFTVPLVGNKEGLKITNVQAFNQQGNVVELTVQN